MSQFTLKTERNNEMVNKFVFFLMETGLHISEGIPFLKDLCSLLKIRDLSSNSLITANFAEKYIPSFFDIFV